MILVDMAGKRFGKWTVLRRGDVKGNNCLYWWCRCDCGKEKQVQGANLRSGQSTQCRKCGCAEAYQQRFEQGGSLKRGYRFDREDLTGRKFNYLTVIGRAENIGTHPAWKVRCDCGSEKNLREQTIVTNRTKSCGCRQKQGQIEAHTKHGMSRSAEYVIWRSMRKRCYNPKHVSYEDYGGRGIKVCEKWRNSFEAFYKDVGPRPSKYHQLHRKDNNGDYEPGNVEWTTRISNMRGRRVTRFVEIGGNRIPIKTFCESIGLPPTAVSYHLDKGRTLEEAISIIRPVVNVQ